MTFDDLHFPFFMRRCWVPHCRNSKSKTAKKPLTRLFKFPRNVERCRKWLRAIGDPDLAKCTWETLTTRRFVCQDHFHASHITATQRAAVNAVPTIFSDIRPPLSEAELLLFDKTVPVERSVRDLGSNGNMSCDEEYPIMEDILVEGESVFKLEEEEEQTRLSLTLLESKEFVESKQELKGEVHQPLPLPLWEPKEEVAEIMLEERQVQLSLPFPVLEPMEVAEFLQDEIRGEMQPPLSLPLLKPNEEFEEIKQEEGEVHLQLPLLEPKEEIADIMQEEELEPQAAVFIKLSDIMEPIPNEKRMNTRRCWVPNCKNSKSKTVMKTQTKLFKFPRDVERCRKWLRAIGDPDLAKCTWDTLTSCRFVCQDHFHASHITATQRAAVNAVPAIFSDVQTPLSEAELLLFEKTVPVEKNDQDLSFNENMSCVEEYPIMEDILVEAESIIKLEEVKEESIDNVEESINLLEEEQSRLLERKEEFAEIKQEMEREVQPPMPLPLLEPKEEVAEIKQEMEGEVQPSLPLPLPLPMLEPKKEFEEIKQEEGEVQSPLPLSSLEPKEEAPDIKEEEELEPPAAVFILSEIVEPKRKIKDPVVGLTRADIASLISSTRDANSFSQEFDSESSSSAKSPSRAESSREDEEDKPLELTQDKRLPFARWHLLNKKRAAALAQSRQSATDRRSSSGNSSSSEEEESSIKPRRSPRTLRLPATHYTESMKAKVVELAKSGKCSVSEAGRRFGVPTGTARRWMRHWKQTGDVRRRNGSGLKRVSTSAEDDLLLATARSKPFWRTSQLKSIIAFPGCERTLCNRLRAAGLSASSSEWCPKIDDAQRVDRVAFALAHARRGWGDVVFSGACVFSAAEDGPVRVSRPQGTQHNAGYVPEPEGCGRASVACWGWVSARGLGVVQRIEPAPLAAQYLHILRHVMLPSARVLYPEGRFRFQQDQQRVHKTDFVQEWIATQKQFHFVDWPPCSGDLNPMGEVWAETKQVMADKWPSPPPETGDALWELVSEAWDEVASREDYAARLVRSLPVRLRQVIENEGHWVP